MAYEAVKAQINAYIKANGVNLITGPVLNAVLTAMLDELGDGYAFQGVLTPSATPTPSADIPQAWLAAQGSYVGGTIVVDEGELAMITHTASGWSKTTVYTASAGIDGVRVSVDAGTGTPSATGEMDGDTLVLSFHNLKGETGPQGQQGIQGVQGPQGPAGSDADVTAENITAALGYTPASSSALAGKQDTISDLSSIRSGASAGATAYQKPGTGIPSTDMASAVQISLGKADAAYQKFSDGVPKSDLASSVQTSLGKADTAIQPAEFNELEEEVRTIGNGVYEEAWDGSSAPVVADIPAGVSVTYNGASYTGTLAASASTVDKIYLVSDGNGNYDRYVTVESSGTYSWKKVGTTAIQLTDYSTKEEVSQLEAEKLDKTAADDTFYITDSNGNIIAQIDSAGVSSVDVKVKVDGVLVSVKSLISSLSGNISTVAGSVAAEKTRAETEEAKKLDHTLTDDVLVIADSNGNIIAKIDACGISSPDVLVGVDGNLVSAKTLIAKKIDQELADDSLEIMDSNGYVIFKIDASGVHSAKDKHAVACMVLGEYYYPTATPTRDTNGNITHVAVMFGTGVAGTLDITYTDGDASQVAVEYGDYTYTISISRDAQGNVETVTVN